MSENNNIDKIRNFSIIAHIDHGKSTISDRLLEITGSVDKRNLKEQMLDDMDLERERGITIKAHPVTMNYTASDGNTYQMNFIDTPGHVDFSYEVSRSLAACEGALLIVDAAQGVQAQTVANMNLAKERGLEIITILNKIDLPAADPDGVKAQIKEMLGIDASHAILTSAKTGAGIADILEEIVYALPPPEKFETKHTKALVFDSHYDIYRGIYTYVRIFSGSLKKGDIVKFLATEKTFEVLEVGIFNPKESPIKELKAGEVGYILANIKNPKDVKVGDTLTIQKEHETEPLPGFKEINPVVYAGVYPVDSADYEALVDALAKLRLNDSALFVEQENSQVLGMGFRCGFLGLLHLEIVFERISREFNIDVITTAPSVQYILKKQNGKEFTVDNPVHFPDPTMYESVYEPWILCNILVPTTYMGAVTNLVNEKRGYLEDMETIDGGRVFLHIKLPLNEVIIDFNDRLKSITQGYASFDYKQVGYEISKIIKLEVRVNEEPVDAFSTLIHASKAESKGREICKRLKEILPKEQFKVPIQAAIGGKIIARETISAMSKNVTAKCYGGDITRKRKLLEKQKKGKAKMKKFGKVSIPQSAFIEILKTKEN
jgi:GTP-binding protein LepA